MVDSKKESLRMRLTLKIFILIAVAVCAILTWLCATTWNTGIIASRAIAGLSGIGVLVLLIVIESKVRKNG